MQNQNLPISQNPTESERNQITEFLKADKLKKAANYAEKLLKIYPNSPMLLNGLSMIYQLDKKPEKAAPILEKIIERQPNNIDALRRLADYQKTVGKYDNATATWEKLLNQTPDNLPALCGLGATYGKLELYQRAAIQFEKAHRLDPKNDKIIESLAQTYSANLQYKLATKYYQMLYALRPHDNQVIIALANSLSHIDHIEEALALCTMLLKRDQSNTIAHLQKSQIFAMIGEPRKALSSYEKILNIDPKNIPALSGRVTVSKITRRNENYLMPLKRIFANSKESNMNRCTAGFALGKGMDDLGKWDEAFAYWKKANAYQLQEEPFDMAENTKQFDTLKRIFEPVDFNNLKPKDAHPVSKPEDKNLIFIVGMPRSGTTLIEQILSSHSAVYGAGELNEMNAITQELLYYFGDQPDISLTEHAFGSIGRSYLDAINALDINQPYVVDKLPNNFLRLGFIRAAFPKAHIIHTNRDPIAVCWSNYRHFFAANGMHFGNDLKKLGLYYKHYLDLMDYWRNKFGDSLYELDYESLTQNQATETRALLDFCGLKFEPACLDFHETKRPIRTASQKQVREKMYTGSTKAWEAYKNHLQPLIDALNLKV